MIDKQNVIDLVLWAIEDDWDAEYVIARINEMPVVNKEDIVSKQQVIDTIMGEPSETYYPCYFAEMIRKLPTVQSGRVWHSCKTPPKHHKDVLVRGTEAIGNITIYKVMQWDVNTWRPINYAPSITWEEWSEI